MKPATLMATVVAALVMTAAFSEPASSCGWRRDGYGAAAAADVGDVRGYRAVRYYRPYRYYRPARLYRPVRYYRPYRLYRPVGVWGPRFRRW